MCSPEDEQTGDGLVDALVAERDELLAENARLRSAQQDAFEWRHLARSAQAEIEHLRSVLEGVKATPDAQAIRALEMERDANRQVIDSLRAEAERLKADAASILLARVTAPPEEVARLTAQRDKLSEALAATVSTPEQLAAAGTFNPARLRLAESERDDAEATVKRLKKEISHFIDHALPADQAPALVQRIPYWNVGSWDVGDLWSVMREALAIIQGAARPPLAESEGATERVRRQLRSRPHLAGECLDDSVELMQLVEKLTAERDDAREQSAHWRFHANMYLRDLARLEPLIGRASDADVASRADLDSLAEQARDEVGRLAALVLRDNIAKIVSEQTLEPRSPADYGDLSRVTTLRSGAWLQVRVGSVAVWTWAEDDGPVPPAALDLFEGLERWLRVPGASGEGQ